MNEESKMNKIQSLKRRHPKPKFIKNVSSNSIPIKNTNEFSWQNFSVGF